MFAPGQNQLLANLSLLLFLRIFRSFVFMILKRTFEECVSLFSYQRSFFALPFVSNSFAIISCCFLPVKNFFQLFWSCFRFSLAATLISYHIQPAVVKNFFYFFLTALWSLWDLSDATLIGYHRWQDLSISFLNFSYNLFIRVIYHISCIYLCPGNIKTAPAKHRRRFYIFPSYSYDPKIRNTTSVSRLWS